jgi:hypothetical protein
MFALHYSSVIL